MPAGTPETAERVDVVQLLGAVMRDSSRADIGRVSAVLLEPETKDARWLEITLHADESTVVVPASAASQVAPGELLVPYGGEHIAAAVHEAGGPVTAEQATRLREHYGFG